MLIGTTETTQEPDSKIYLRKFAPVLEGGDSLQIQHLLSSGKVKEVITFYVFITLYTKQTKMYNPLCSLP